MQSDAMSSLSREVTEHAYETVPEIPNTSGNMNTIHDTHLLNQNQNQNQNQNAHNYSHPVYSIPSMTSPPPTYDVAINKSWQVNTMPSQISIHRLICLPLPLQPSPLIWPQYKLLLLFIVSISLFVCVIPPCYLIQESNPDE